MFIVIWLEKSLGKIHYRENSSKIDSDEFMKDLNNDTAVQLEITTLISELNIRGKDLPEMLKRQSD